MTDAIAEFDAVQHFWCPMLGQPLNFGYCRRAADGRPCHRVLICYESHFPVQDYLDRHYSPEEQAAILGGAKSRLERVAEALDASKAGE